MLSTNARSLCLGSGLGVCLWLAVPFVACSGSTEGPDGSLAAGSAGKAGAGGQAGSGGMGGTHNLSGASGHVGGGEGGEGGAEQSGPRVLDLVHENGSWLVRLDDTEGLYTLTCSGREPSLVEQDPPKNAASPPPFGEFFIDGEFFDIPENLGCDFQDCRALPSQLGISDTGYVSVGTLPRPSGAGGDGGAGAGGDGGAGGSGGSLIEVPAFASYAVDGPFVLTLRYFTDSKCTNLVEEEPRVLKP